MGKSSASLTKTCIHCGQQKPLSAFLELSGPQGTTYGSLCSSCRKANIDKLNVPQEPEESTTSTTGVRIDAKKKVKGEVDKREFRKQAEELYFDEREDKQKKQLTLNQKIQHVAQDEKKHRKSFLEKRSFLDSAKKPLASSTPIFGGEEHNAQAGKLDFATGPVEYTRVAGQVKLTQSPIYQAFKSWLGNAPIVGAAEKAARQKKNNPPEKTHEKTEGDALDDYANKNYGPSSK